MTAGKRFKRLVRARSSKTGESYSAALRHFRASTAEGVAMSEFELVRVEKPNFGFAMHIPADWREEPPNLNNSPHEVARFYYRGATVKGIVVMRNPKKGESSARAWAEETREVLETLGSTNFALTELQIADRPAARLDFEMPQPGALRSIWVTHEYFVVAFGIGFCFTLGSETPEADETLFGAIAERLEVFEPRSERALIASNFANWFPRPRAAYAAAQARAGRRGEAINAMHMLIGLMEIGDGVAFNALRATGLTPDRLASEFEREPVSETVGDTSALTPQTYQMLATAAPQLAATLGHPYIGTEHLLLAILTAEADDGASLLLEAAGTTNQAVRNALADELEQVIERTVRGVAKA